MGEPRHQPVPDPGNLHGYLRLLNAGKLVDLAGRPLTLVDCRWCKAQATSGVTCPYAMECPEPGCRARPGSNCRRPSGHVLSKGFGAGPHRRRLDAAYKVDDERAAAGDLTVPAPWPVANPAPVEPDQAVLFDLAGVGAAEGGGSRE